MDLRGVLAALAMLPGLSSCRGPEETAAPLRIEIPEGVTAPWADISPEGRGWAYTELRRSEAFMVANGRRLGPYS